MRSGNSHRLCIDSVAAPSRESGGRGRTERDAAGNRGAVAGKERFLTASEGAWGRESMTGRCCVPGRRDNGPWSPGLPPSTAEGPHSGTDGNTVRRKATMTRPTGPHGPRLRERLGDSLFARVAGPEGPATRARIHGTPGPRWFGPDRPIRRVHGDASMFIGGLSALLLQSLHPLAMAAVSAHSGFRGDPWGRLQRTSTFLAVTTYGTAASAQEACDRVRAVHERVRGVTGEERRTTPRTRGCSAGSTSRRRTTSCARTSVTVYARCPTTTVTRTSRTPPASPPHSGSPTRRRTAPSSPRD